jgi:transcription initiation factor IIE alpha subunit
MALVLQILLFHQTSIKWKRSKRFLTIEVYKEVGEIMDYSSYPALPEEFRILSMMHNIGAITPERSLTVEDLVQWTDIDNSKIRAHLQRLKELGYVQHIETSGIQKYHLTKIGLLKVLTLYS